MMGITLDIFNFEKNGDLSSGASIKLSFALAFDTLPGLELSPKI